jgi:omega-6 fatty acid desaturase (delta-12 desaturase)
MKTRPEWYEATARFQKPALRKSIWQILNTFIPYFALWYVMIRLLQAGTSYITILLLAIPTGLFLVRIFIFFHDCTHGSFFASKGANTLLGYITGILTFTPFDRWRSSHWTHHATVADLDRRGTGDFWTMTKKEYLQSPKWKRIVYRIARNPLVIFGLGPIFIFLVYQRFPFLAKTKRDHLSVYLTNLGILAVVLLAGFTIGFKNYILIQLPVSFVAGLGGLWLFYVQHNFEGVYWARHEEWDRFQAALEGSSYYKLPRILQWFTGNIGFHPIHHIRPLIPNYNLEACYRSEAAFQEIEPLTIPVSLKSLILHLWDEGQQKLVGFGSLRWGTE